MANRRRWLFLAAGVATVLVIAGVAIATRGGSSKQRLALTGASAGGPAASSSSSSTTSSVSNTSSMSSSTTATSRPFSPTSTTTTAVPGPLVITEADTGQSYVVHIGQQIDVELSARPIYTWSEPESSNDVVVHRTAGSAGDSASATFVGETNGSADITSQHNPKCRPQCAAMTILFQVHITVVP